MVTSPNTEGVYAVAIVLGVIGVISISLRYAARRRSTGWKIDDWLLLIAMLFLWVLAAILIYGASVETIGTHTQVNAKTGAVIVTPHENQMAMLASISRIFTVMALGTLKAGVVLFYRRSFSSDFFKKASLGILILIAAWTTAFFFATIFQCKGQKLNLTWLSIQTFLHQCYEYKTILFAHCITDLITDIIVLAMPIREIWKLQMKVQQKITVSLIFGVGLLSIAASTARLAIVAKDIIETTGGSRDVRGVETNALVSAYVEIGVAIVAACLPTYGPIANSRGLETVIASVRSMVSLASIGSGSRNASTTGPQFGPKDHDKGIELVPYAGDGLNQTRSEVGRGDDFHKMPGRESIRREDSVTVSRDNVGQE